MEKLSEIPVFQGIEPDELETCFQKIIFQRKKYNTDNLVAVQGDACDRLICLLHGSVKTEMSDPTGKSLKIEDLYAPAVLAPAFLFGNRAVFPVNIIATDEIEIIQIPRPELMKLFQLNQRILQNYLGMISSRAQFLSEKLRFHSFRSLKAKLAYYLLKESGKQTSFKMKHSQNDLAELFGVARPSVGRVFLQMQEEGLIDIRYREVTLLDTNRLAALFRE
jgi:CRP/FNR family transcriptional regulator, dissimilatory nitrate respiration regulator